MIAVMTIGVVAAILGFVCLELIMLMTDAVDEISAPLLALMSAFATAPTSEAEGKA